MTTICNSRYSNKKLVVGNFGVLNFNEKGEAEASEEMASALTSLKGFKVIRKKEEIKRQPIEGMKEKLPKFSAESMPKAWLEDFGKRVYGVELDRRKSAAALYRILKKLETEQV